MPSPLGEDFTGCSRYSFQYLNVSCFTHFFSLPASNPAPDAPEVRRRAHITATDELTR